jgi:hypothetical protein
VAANEVRFDYESGCTAFPEACDCLWCRGEETNPRSNTKQLSMPFIVIEISNPGGKNKNKICPPSFDFSYQKDDKQLIFLMGPKLCYCVVAGDVLT